DRFRDGPARSPAAGPRAGRQPWRTGRVPHAGHALRARHVPEGRGPLLGFGPALPPGRLVTRPRSPATILASAGVAAGPGRRALVPPIEVSDTFQWDDPETKPDYDYSRTVNPNRDLLVAALAELEGAAGGVATNSGQSAALLALLLLPAGATVVAPHDCYGGTYRLIQGLADQGKLKAIFVDQKD